MAELCEPEGVWRVRERHEILSTMKDRQRKSADVSNDSHEAEMLSSLSPSIESESNEAIRKHGSLLKTTAQKQSKQNGQKRKYDLRPQRQKAIIEVSDGEDDLAYTDSGTTTSGSDTLRQHMNLKTRVICIHCERSSSTRSNLFTHLISQHSEDVENAEKLVRVAKVVQFSTTQKPFVCNLCSRSYGNPVSLQEHIRSHTSETTKCPVCNKVYSNQKDLQRHMQKHRRRTRFMCPDCPYNCLTDRVFWQHMIVEHKFTAQEAKSLVCSIKKNEVAVQTNDSDQVSQGAEKNYATKVRKRPSRPFRMSKCGKTNAAKPFLRAPNDHVAVDIGQSFPVIGDSSSVTFVLDDPSVPGVSDNSFDFGNTGEDQQPNNSQIPQIESEMEFSCLSCNRTYHSTRSLRRHICSIINKLHVESAFKKDMGRKSDGSCALDSKVPSKTLSRRKQLKQLQESAEKLHENRPAMPMDKNGTSGCTSENSSFGKSQHVAPLKHFQCKICLKKFPRSTSLAVHIVRAHDGKITRYLCTLCGRKFWKSDQLQMHVLKIHHVAPEVAAKFTSKYPKDTSKQSIQCHSKPSAARRSVEYAESAQTATNMEQPKKKGSVSFRCSNRSELALNEHCVFPTTQNSMESDLVACITHFTQAVQKIPTLISESLRGMQSVLPPCSSTSSMCLSVNTCQCGQGKKGS